jgi:hypothetical protein
LREIAHPEAVAPSNPSPAGEWGAPPAGSPQSTGSQRKFRIGAAPWVVIAIAIFALIVLFAVL